MRSTTPPACACATTRSRSTSCCTVCPRRRSRRKLAALDARRLASSRIDRMVNAKKLLRSLIVFAPGLQGARFRAEARLLRTLRKPYQPEFAGLRDLPLHDPLVLDVGCSRGIAVESILAMRPDARVIGFEANAMVAAETKRWFARDPRVEILPFGLGSRPGSVDIHVPRYRNYRFDGFGSFDRAGAERLMVNDWLYWFDPRHMQVETV